MININTTMQAGQVLDFYDRGDFLRVMEAERPLTITFYRNGAEVSRAVDVSEGYAEKFEGGGQFDRVTVLSETEQQVQIVSRLGNVVAYDKAPTGNIVLSGQQGPMTQAAATVINASRQLLAENWSRRFLLVQNNHATASVFLNLAGAAATVGAGVKLGPGGSLLLDNFVPGSAIFAIGDIASNTAVTVVEG